MPDTLEVLCEIRRGVRSSRKCGGVALGVVRRVDHALARPEFSLSVYMSLCRMHFTNTNGSAVRGRHDEELAWIVLMDGC